jgi:hypothetical protein
LPKTAFPPRHHYAGTAMNDENDMWMPIWLWTVILVLAPQLWAILIVVRFISPILIVIAILFVSPMIISATFVVASMIVKSVNEASLFEALAWSLSILFAVWVIAISANKSAENE